MQDLDTPRSLRLAALGLVVVLCAAACRPVSPPPEASPPTPRHTPAALQNGEGDPPGDGGTVRYAIGEPTAIVPVEAVGGAALTVVDALFDSLTYWGPPPGSRAAGTDLQARPSAARSWSSDSEARTWTFRLRPGATYHDGSTPVTAADFVFAWELAVRTDQVGYHLRDVDGYEAVRAGDTDELAGVTAIDEHTLEVRLAQPNAEFPTVVGHPALGPLPRALWEADPDAFRQRPIGNGPFAASEAWAHGAFVRVAPFEGWRNRVTRPSVTEVVFQIMDLDTAYLAFQQGRLDFTDLPPGALEDAVAAYGESQDGYSGPGVLRGDTPVLYYVGFNLAQAPFDDVEVRRAVSQAVDRSALTAEVLDGNVRSARSMVPPVLPGSGIAPCPTCRHEPAAAQEVFAERDITSLALWFNRGGGHEPVARHLRRDLRAVGVRLELRTEEFPDYLAVLESGEAGLYRFGWAVDYPSMDNALYPLLHSSARPGRESAHNYGGYAASDVDALLDEARATTDPQERHARYAEAADLALNRDQVVVPLFTYRHSAVASDRLRGLVYNPLGYVDLVSVRVVEPGD